MNEGATSRRRAIDTGRSALKLAAFFGAIGLALLLGRYPGTRIFLGLGAFFLVVGAIELLNPAVRRRKPAEAPADATTPPPAPGEFAAYLLRNEHAFGTTLVLAGRVVLLDLREDELLDRRKAFSRELIARATELEENFEAFRKAEAARNERYANVILGLQIEWISFNDHDPESGEVYFTKESGEDFILRIAGPDLRRPGHGIVRSGFMTDRRANLTARERLPCAARSETDRDHRDGDGDLAAPKTETFVAIVPQFVVSN